MEQYQERSTTFISAEERVQLVGFCTYISGRPDVAEDLTQETLLEAWRHEQALLDPALRPQWLRGIARNVYLRWQRRQGREETQRYQGIGCAEQDELAADQIFVDEYTLELDLERKELLELLDRALALLPLETQTVLIQHYINETPLAEVAQQLGSSPNALAVRLQRGKLALRRILTQDMHEEFATHHQLSESASWETTPLWCYRCGRQRLLGKRVSNEGKFWLKCPECSPGGQILSRNELPALRGMKSYKPMLARLQNFCHTHYRAALSAHFAGEPLGCISCSRPLTILLVPPGQLPAWIQDDLWNWQWSLHEARLLSTFCYHCQEVCSTTLSGLVLNIPEARTFMQEQQRIRTLPYRSLETEGRPALLTRLESVTGQQALNIISDEETYRLLRIEREGF